MKALHVLLFLITAVLILIACLLFSILQKTENPASSLQEALQHSQATSTAALSQELSALRSEVVSLRQEITAKLDQARESEDKLRPDLGLCLAFDTDSAARCRPGSTLIFMPLRWGNDQLPILVAGNNCDFNYSVIYNNGGVACVRRAEDKPKNKPEDQPATESSAKPGSEQKEDSAPKPAGDSTEQTQIPLDLRELLSPLQ